jgi:hypothetical protein
MAALPTQSPAAEVVDSLTSGEQLVVMESRRRFALRLSRADPLGERTEE